MPTTTHQIVIERGTSFDLVIICTDQNGAPYPLDGYVPSSQVRQHYSANSVACIPTCTLNTPATDGQINFSISAEQTAALRPGTYVYDVVVTGTSDDVIRVLTGTIVIDPTVKR